MSIENNIIKFTTRTIDWTMGDVCNLTLWATAGKCFYVDWGDGTIRRYESRQEGWTTIYYCYDLTNDYKKHPVKFAEYEVVIFTKDADCVLTALDVKYYDMSFPKVDVSACPSLVGLRCDGNALTTLDLSNNAALKWLNCGSNALTNLDVSKNIALQKLNCSRNKIASLDLRNNNALQWLKCNFNGLHNLLISNQSVLCKGYYREDNHIKDTPALWIEQKMASNPLIEEKQDEYYSDFNTFMGCDYAYQEAMPN
jgi:hypothetical protein